jgi:uncharacterized membrane protein YeaQ/YmgE (transglycosylase-associated protein family)
VGLYVRWIRGDEGYGAVADALLGITGAFAAAWAIGQGEIAWSSRATATIWAAAALPCIAHVIARRDATVPGPQVRRRGF